jgi:hypothetical protein
MRTREEIIGDPKGYDALAVEVLLDIRSLLQKPPMAKQPRQKRTRKPTTK